MPIDASLLHSPYPRQRTQSADQSMRSALRNRPNASRGAHRAMKGKCRGRGRRPARETNAKNDHKEGASRDGSGYTCFHVTEERQILARLSLQNRYQGKPITLTATLARKKKSHPNRIPIAHPRTVASAARSSLAWRPRPATDGGHLRESSRRRTNQEALKHGDSASGTRSTWNFFCSFGCE